VRALTPIERFEPRFSEVRALARRSLVPVTMKSTVPGCIGVLLLSTVACGSESIEPSESTDSALRRRDMLDATRDASGKVQTASSTGAIDTTNPFFQSLGTNGRTCNSCHVASQGWTVTPAGLRERFEHTDGTDPIFLPHDGANAPNLDVSTESARRKAYSLLLSRGVIRVGLPVKPTSEFQLVAVDDPYGFASAAQLSLFRRPLPTTNLRFLSTVNWDGRNTPASDDAGVHLGLKNQANGATVNHAKATAPIDDATRESIVAFETSITTAQVKSDALGWLTAAGATGGPAALLTQPFAIGVNDPSKPGFDHHVFSIYDAWSGGDAWIYRGRRDVAEGQRIFNEKTFSVAPGRTGTCSGCHNTPNVGSSSTFRFFDVGVSSAARRKPDVPLYTFQNIATGETIQTTDPGRALITGKWADMNRFKPPSLRGLAARPPYFHDGSAASIADVVSHYEARFGIAFEGCEKEKLIKFLEAL
jgi:hypothetical protein